MWRNDVGENSSGGCVHVLIIIIRGDILKYVRAGYALTAPQICNAFITVSTCIIYIFYLFNIYQDKTCISSI